MHELDNYGEASLARPLWARWLTRILLLICGLLMAVVMLSQPKIAEKVQKNGGGLSHYLSDAKAYLFGTQEESAALAPAAEVGPPPPVSGALPQTRLPVHRAGVVRSN